MDGVIITCTDMPGRCGDCPRTTTHHLYTGTLFAYFFASCTVKSQAYTTLIHMGHMYILTTSLSCSKKNVCIHICECTYEKGLSRADNQFCVSSMRSKCVSRATQWNLNYLCSMLLTRVIVAQSVWSRNSLLREKRCQTLRKSLALSVYSRKHAHARHKPRSVSTRKKGEWRKKMLLVYY